MATDRQTEPSALPAASTGLMARWLTVLEAYARRPEWGVRDLAAATGLPRSSVHRIVREMTSLGLLTPAGTNGRAEVGPTLMRLAVSLTEHVDVLRVAGPVLDALRDETGETAILHDPRPDAADVPRGDRGRVVPRHPLHLGIAPGVERAVRRGERQGHPRVPRARGAAAESSTRSRTRCRRHPARRRTPSSHRCHERRATATSSAMASASRARSGSRRPLRDATGRVVGSVLLGWPDNRTDASKERAAAQAAVKAADAISASLGYPRAPVASPARSVSARVSRATRRPPR